MTMLRISTLLPGLLLSALALAQTPIIFQPGPGLNDGTDEGGLNGGKDVYTWDEQFSSNFGTATQCGSSPISTCNQTNRRGYIKFDLSTLPSTATQHGGSITGATHCASMAPRPRRSAP